MARSLDLAIPRESFNAVFLAPAKGGGASLANLLSTHPSLEKRLGQLVKISAQPVT